MKMFVDSMMKILRRRGNIMIEFAIGAGMLSACWPPSSRDWLS
jgi:hypothetical protein